MKKKIKCFKKKLHVNRTIEKQIARKLHMHRRCRNCTDVGELTIFAHDCTKLPIKCTDVCRALTDDHEMHRQLSK